MVRVFICFLVCTLPIPANKLYYLKNIQYGQPVREGSMTETLPETDVVDGFLPLETF